MPFVVANASAAKPVVRTGKVTADATAGAGWDDSTLVVTTRRPACDDSSYATVERCTLGADSKTDVALSNALGGRRKRCRRAAVVHIEKEVVARREPRHRSECQRGGAVVSTGPAMGRLVR